MRCVLRREGTGRVGVRSILVVNRFQAMDVRAGFGVQRARNIHGCDAEWNARTSVWSAQNPLNSTYRRSRMLTLFAPRWAAQSRNTRIRTAVKFR